MIVSKDKNSEVRRGAVLYLRRVKKHFEEKKNNGHNASTFFLLPGPSHLQYGSTGKFFLHTESLKRLENGPRLYGSAAKIYVRISVERASLSPDLAIWNLLPLQVVLHFFPVQNH